MLWAEDRPANELFCWRNNFSRLAETDGRTSKVKQNKKTASIGQKFWSGKFRFILDPVHTTADNILNSNRRLDIRNVSELIKTSQSFAHVQE